MISFKEYIELREGRLARGVAIAGAVGGALGLYGGAKLGDAHNAEIAAKNTHISQTISKGKKMVDAQKWAREKKVTAVTSAALSKPAERLSSEIPKDKMGDFSKALERDDFADNVHARIHHQYPDKDMTKARTRVIDPEAEKTMETPRVTYSGGSKYSMNYKTMPQDWGARVEAPIHEPPKLAKRPKK